MKTFQPEEGVFSVIKQCLVTIIQVFNA